MGEVFRGWRRKTGIATLVVASILAGGWLFVQFAAWRRAAMYPYGWSHCCDTGLFLALRHYADAHGGEYPAGEVTPEASLSLLCIGGLADANLLRGKSVPETTVQEILDRGELLGPDSCGWHYVEGLRTGDNPRLAIFWDKAGLDHNGLLLSDGGHIVWCLNSSHERISASEWTKFLAEQGELHRQRASSAITPDRK